MSGHPVRAAPPGPGAASGESAPLRDGQEEAARFVSSCLIKCLLRIRSKQDHNRPRPPSGPPPPQAQPRPGCNPVPPEQALGPCCTLSGPWEPPALPQGPRTQGGSQRSGPPWGMAQPSRRMAARGMASAQQKRRCVWPVTSPGAGRARQKPRGGLEHLFRLGAVARAPPPFLAATPRLTRCQRSAADSRSPVREGASPQSPAPRLPMGLTSLQPRVPNPEVLSPGTRPPWRRCWVSFLGQGCCWRLGMVPSIPNAQEGQRPSAQRSFQPQMSAGAARQPCAEGPPDPRLPQAPGRPSEVPGGRAGRNSP